MCSGSRCLTIRSTRSPRRPPRRSARTVWTPPSRPHSPRSTRAASVRSIYSRPLPASACAPSVHPLQTFAGGEPAPEALAAVPIAVTARPDDEAFGFALAEAIGGHPFALPDENKPLYHLAATVASNLLVALESEAAGLIGEAIGGGPADGLGLLARLVETTVTNLRAEGSIRALTGPVARGDVGTVRAHLALLETRTPRLAAAYRALSLEALALAAPRLDNENVRALRRALEHGAPR